MKYREARRVMADLERAKRRLEDIEARRIEDAAEFEKLREGEAEIKRADGASGAIRIEKNELRSRHEQEMAEVNRRLREADENIRRITEEFQAKNAAALTRRSGLAVEKSQARSELAKLENRAKDAAERLSRSEERREEAERECERCDGNRVVPKLCADPKHDSTKPTEKNAGEFHACGLGVEPCPGCVVKVVKIEAPEPTADEKKRTEENRAKKFRERSNHGRAFVPPKEKPNQKKLERLGIAKPKKPDAKKVNEEVKALEPAAAPIVEEGAKP